jgi:hypothetical protein
MPGDRQCVVLIVVALQIGDLEFYLEYGGLEGQKNFLSLLFAVTS